MILPGNRSSREESKPGIFFLAAWIVLAFMAAVFAACTGKAAGFGPQEQASQQTSQRADQKDQQAVEPSAIAVPLPKGKKLVLTNGTFQIVREYHREGDRVRYYSLERSAWEEIPAALVDWDATQKAEAEQNAKQEELARQIAETEKAERFADLNVDTSFEVRPGVFLPDNVGFYVIDGNKVTTMQQEKAETHTDKGRAVAKIVTGVPLINSKQEVEIPGKQAKLRIHTGDAEFYFRTADKREPHLALMRADVKGEKRLLEAISTNIVGQQKYKNHEVSLLQWDAARGLYRFTVDQALEPGEYAIIETTTEEGQSMYVWTFGVDLAGNAKSVSAKPTAR